MKQDLHVPQIEEFSDLPKPIPFFENYIPESIFQQITNMTNLYATQKNLARFPPATIEEIKKVFAINILMENFHAVGCIGILRLAFP
jgi:hypothetical protein